MKRLFALALLACAPLVAATLAFGAPQPAIEHYRYSMHLDVAKVLSISPIPDVCDVVPVWMTYLDHRGQRHVLEYSEWGTGCDHG